MVYFEEINRKEKELWALSDWMFASNDKRARAKRLIMDALEKLERDALRSGRMTVKDTPGEFQKILVTYSPDRLAITTETEEAIKTARAACPKIRLPMMEPDNKPGSVEIVFGELLRLTAEKYWEEGARRARME